MKVKRPTIRIEENIHKSIKVKCVTQGITIQQYFNKLIEKDLKKTNK